MATSQVPANLAAQKQFRQKAGLWSFRNEQQIACLLVTARLKFAQKGRNPRDRKGGELRNQRNVLKSALGIRQMEEDFSIFWFLFILCWIVTSFENVPCLFSKAGELIPQNKQQLYHYCCPYPYSHICFCCCYCQTELLQQSAFIRVIHRFVQLSHKILSSLKTWSMYESSLAFSTDPST